MEQSFVAWAKMRAKRLPQVKLGIGDDAAVLATDGQDLVVTADSMMEGVHFRLAEVGPKKVGRKLANVNLSDLAAMAARPASFFLSICVPINSEQAADVIAAGIYEGVCEVAEENGVALAGGDTNCWTGPLVVHLTATGTSDGEIWYRSGACPEDHVVVTGALGGSILGKHLDFSPRFDVVNQLRGKELINAAMDISDGLSVDLLRMCDASKCGAILNLDQVPVTAEARQLAESSDRTAIEHALGDGEDFELLMAVSKAKLPQIVDLLGEDRVFVCGEFTSRTGLWMREGGRISQLTSSGYVHGR